MALCVTAGTVTTMIAASAFSLSWEHSVERQRWEERWRIEPAGLVLEEARVRGSGAGMEPPEGSVLESGWWVYRPELPPLPSLVLAASGVTRSAWLLCADGACRELGVGAGPALVLEPCPRQ